MLGAFSSYVLVGLAVLCVQLLNWPTEECYPHDVPEEYIDWDVDNGCLDNKIMILRRLLTSLDCIDLFHGVGGKVGPRSRLLRCCDMEGI